MKLRFSARFAVLKHLAEQPVRPERWLQIANKFGYCVELAPARRDGRRRLSIGYPQSGRRHVAVFMWLHASINGLTAVTEGNQTALFDHLSELGQQQRSGLESQTAA